ncbi:hypothetical protein IQ06DRAFT_369180 [Phaeosphaeriaceae sp. SRC1lsM3a]|nr:hypothetical protein IQ06DRAFT_369180 [Stagonospora sp. SRC1lsM3a]
MIEHSSEQTSRMRRLSHWLCIPFRRAPPSSYIDPTPPVRQTEQAEIPVLTSPAQLQQLNRGNNVLIINDKTLDNDRRPRSRYRPARPQSRVPTYQSLDTRQPGKDKLGYASRSCDRAITRQEGTLSANSNALRINDQKRNRSVVDKNKHLPQSLRAQPPYPTKAILERNDRRSGDQDDRNGAGLSDSTLRPPGELPVPDPINAANTGRMPSMSRSPQRRSRNRHSWHGHDWYQQSRSRESSTSRENSQRRRQSRRSLPPPNTEIVPLRGDSGKVLVHSRSRGYKIVRNLVSLNGLRDMVCEHNNQPRHVASLERMAEEDRRASQELFS